MQRVHILGLLTLTFLGLTGCYELPDIGTTQPSTAYRTSNYRLYEESERDRVAYERERGEQARSRDYKDRLWFEHEAYQAKLARDSAERERARILRESQMIRGEEQVRFNRLQQEQQRAEALVREVQEQQRAIAEANHLQQQEAAHARAQQIARDRALAEQLQADEYRRVDQDNQRQAIERQRLEREQRLRESEARSLERSRARIEREAQLPVVPAQEPVLMGIPGGINPVD